MAKKMPMKPKMAKKSAKKMPKGDMPKKGMASKLADKIIG